MRAIAALAVVVHHIELFKSGDHIASLCQSHFFSFFIRTLGKNGVHLFFVLSGFLITYLLLKEKEEYQSIFLKKFFYRRILRIWPLYYLIVFIGFVLIPFLAHSFDLFGNATYWYGLISNPINYSAKSVVLYLLFLPNLALKYFLVPGCSQSWSVGVEEQFYILWPFLIYLFTRKKIVWVFLLLLLFIFFSNIFLPSASAHFISKSSFFQSNLIHRIRFIIKVIPFEFMTIGAIGGYLYAYYKVETINFTKSKFIYLGVLILMFTLLLFPITSSYFQNIILGFLFLCLILITINEENSIIFRNRQMSYLGKISYGIYMYHPLVLFLVFPFANKYIDHGSTLLFYNLFVYFFTFLFTILLSHFSYKYFESVFIKIKDTKYKSL